MDLRPRKSTYLKQLILRLSMIEPLLTNYLFVLAFMLLSLGFAVSAIAVAYFIAPRSTGSRKLDTYESGMTPIGQAWIQFGVAYYLYALMFLAFDVEALFLFPVLTIYGMFPWRDFVEVFIFLGILALAIVYAWRKGVFEW